MHYLQLFITKHDKDETVENVKRQAESQIEEYLEAYQDVYWDWYSFGGRWEKEFGGDITVPYERALLKLKEMIENRNSDIEELREKVKPVVNGEVEPNPYGMEGFYLKQLGYKIGNYYHDDPLFYNIETFEAFGLVDEGEDFSQYYVTIVDLHN